MGRDYTPPPVAAPAGWNAPPEEGITIKSDAIHELATWWTRLDEPTGNLDTARSMEIMGLLTDLNREQGITVIMVTHEPDMAAYAKRIVHFCCGLVSSDKKTEENPS